jgi:Na+-driven multidrug efflux pump
MSRSPAPDGRRQLERRIISLAIPALGTLAVEPVYVLVDTAIVGRLGTPQLAGLAIASTILLTAVSLMTFLEYGVTPDVAYAHGAGRPDDAHRSAGDALSLAVSLGTPVAVALAALAGPLVWLLGGRGAVAHAAVTYLRISTIGLPFVLLTLVGHGVTRGVNRLRIPMVIVLVANVANLILELIAVYGMHLGIAGSAWSTVIVQILAALWFLRVLRPHTRRHAPSWQRYAHIDTPTLAAHQVLTQLFMFLALALDALAIPAQSLVAGALGSGDVDGAQHVGWISNRLSLWCGAALAATLAVFSPVIPHIFTGDGAVRSRLVTGLLILAVMQLPGAVAFALDGALIGAHDERFLGRQAVYNLAGFVPLAVATLIWPRLGLAGLWGAQLMWMTLRAAVNFRRWQSRRWARVEAGSTTAATA